MSNIAFIFPGQGAQYVGMGEELYNNIPESKVIFQIAENALNFPITEMCFKGPKEELDKTENTQPAILAVSIAALRAFEKYNITPRVTAGLSLGEYGALVCSGVLSFEQAIRLVKKRGRYMQEAVPAGVGGMVAVLGLSAEKVAELCELSKEKGIIEVANYNCPGQIVIAGEIAALDYAEKLSIEMGALKAVRLSVSAPFHSSMLEPAALNLEKELETIELGKMEVPVISNVTGDFMEEANIKQLLRAQVKTSVQWEKTINKMLEEGIDTFIEFGPGKTLSTFIRKVDRKAKVFNIEDMKSLEKTINSIV